MSSSKGRLTRWSADPPNRALIEQLAIPVGVTESQLQSIMLQLRLDEINRKLATGDHVPRFEIQLAASLGRTSVDREELQARWKRSLEEERASLIEQVLRSNPEWDQEMDYGAWLSKHVFGPGSKSKFGAGNKPYEKVWIPQADYPHINFVGLLIGPRGNTLRKMEAETGAKISIRGKGAHKDGKHVDAAIAGLDEPLHAFVMADTPEAVSRAVRIITRIVEQAATLPEEANELKKNQLRELATLNGTVRQPDEAIVCSNCGQLGHRRFECMERPNVTASLTCRICGAAGHTANDCLHRDNPQMLASSRQRNAQVDAEYSSFMAELGGGAAAQAQAQAPQGQAGDASLQDPNAAYYQSLTPEQQAYYAAYYAQYYAQYQQPS